MKLSLESFKTILSMDNIIVKNSKKNIFKEIILKINFSGIFIKIIFYKIILIFIFKMKLSLESLINVTIIIINIIIFIIK